MNTRPDFNSAFILQILTHTPAWVWGLLAALLALGFWQMRTQRVNAWRLASTPLGLGIFSIISAWQSFGAASVLAWAAGVALAFALNTWLLHWPGQAQRDGAKWVMPGSVLPMLLILGIFMLRYAVSVFLAVQGPQAGGPLFVPASAAAFGLLSGLFAARAWRVWRMAV